MYKTSRNILLALGFLTMPVAAWADGIDTPGVYVYIDLKVREITLDGMQHRLELLLSGTVDRPQLRSVDAETRKKIDLAFAQWGTSASGHAAYGTRHAEEIRRWIDRHPDAVREYDELESQFQSLSLQLNRVR